MDELARNIHIPVVGVGDVVAYRTITSATVSNIENDKNNPSADIIIALSDFFNISTDWILKGKEFIKEMSDFDGIGVPQITLEDLSGSPVNREQILYIAERINDRAQDVFDLSSKMKSVHEEISMLKNMLEQMSQKLYEAEKKSE